MALGELDVDPISSSLYQGDESQIAPLAEDRTNLLTVTKLRLHL